MTGGETVTTGLADDPGNRRGDPPGAPVDGGAGSGNFQRTAPVLSLPGRGVDISLALTYNSRLWNKANNNINFDIDRDWPAPGWSLGFGKMLAISINNGCMLIDADGTRHSFTGTIQFFNWGTIGTFHTTDGSFIDYNYQTGTNGIITFAEARWPNGTVVTYGAHSTPGGGVFPTSIRDANGNYITITYVNNQGPRIQTVTDTLGRVITFHYDSLNRLTAITAPDLGSGTRTLVRLHYSQLTLGYHFSGLTPIVRDAVPWVIDAIYYPGTGTGYWFDQSSGAYSSYGMLRRVSERRGMTFSGPSPVPPVQGTTEQGTITAGQITNEEFYNYPLNTGDVSGTPGSNLTDAPTFTSRTESWTRDGTSTMDQAITTYNVTETTGVRTTTITQPNGTKVVQYSHNLPGNFLDGLIYEDRTLDSADNQLQKSTVAWEQGAYESARPTRIEAISGSNPKTATEFSYGTLYNQVTDLRSYDYGGTALLRSTRTQYQNSSNYINRHIFSLPLVVEVFAGDNTTRVSRTEYQYDGQPLANTPGVIMHDDAFDPHFEPILMPGDCYWDCTVPIGEPCIWVCDPDWWYNPYNSATDYRGNLTQETSYADAVNLTGAVIETDRYDMTGNVITKNNSCCQQTSTTFTVDSYYAHPISETRGSDTNGFSQVKTSATYDFNTSLILSTTDADGRTSQASYDSATLRIATRTLPTGAHTDYAYDDTAMTVTETTYLQAHPTHTTITSQGIRLMNGRGDVRQEKALAAGGAWDVVDTIYDSMGLVSQESRPYRSGDTIQWTTTTYDALNRIISVQHPDGSTMQSFYNESSRPNVASISPGETTRIQDAWGRERWSREDSSGRTVEVVEPNPSGSGSVTTGGLVTTYAYNTLDDLVLVTQGSQTRSFKYDSLGRLSAQKSAEGNAKLNDAGVFVGSGTWSDVFTYDDRSNMISHTDARGVKTIFSYNGDPLNRLQSVSWDTTGFGDTANPILAAPTVTFQYRTKSSSTDLLDVEQVSGFTVAGVVTETYTFDTEGRMSSKTVTITNRASYPMVVNYNYDAIVRRV
jgi:YD repeat-containing protein